jgi:hypothetical protein
VQTQREIQAGQQSSPPKKITRRVMLPESAQISEETADAADARKIRWGMSPSYHVNLSHLVGNRWTGYHEILPRRLYRFEIVRPTGINEQKSRMDDEGERAATQTVGREPRTCAEDVQAMAGEKVFIVFPSLTAREDGQEIFDAVYPVEVEARIWLMTADALRTPQVKGKGTIEPHLLEYCEAEGIRPPYRAEGHALAEFIRYFEEDAHGVVDADTTLTDGQREVAHEVVDEVLEGARNAFQHRYSRLSNSFGLMEERQTSGTGKKKLDPHDEECLAETGIVQSRDKPVEASQKMGAEIGKQIAEGQAEHSGQLAGAVERLAEAQSATQSTLAQIAEQSRMQGEALLILLRERGTQQQ